MDDPWAELPVTRSINPRLRLIRARLGELLSLTLDMLMIALVSLVLCVLTGKAEHTTLAAMGIAIYISCKHFSYLRKEITSLREQVALSTARPDWHPFRSVAEDRHEGWHEWQDEAYVPDHGTRAA